jgi:hypothetical protein
MSANLAYRRSFGVDLRESPHSASFLRTQGLSCLPLFDALQNLIVEISSYGIHVEWIHGGICSGPIKRAINLQINDRRALNRYAG